jgi:hypothetical protein
VDDCYALALEVFTPEGREIWMAHPNPMLAGDVPRDLLDAGHAERVYGLLLALAEGVTL